MDLIAPLRELFPYRFRVDRSVRDVYPDVPLVAISEVVVTSRAEILHRHQMFADRAEELFRRHDGRWGAARIAGELAENGWPANKQQVMRALRSRGLRADRLPVPRETLSELIERIFCKHGGRFGARRIATELARDGVAVSEATVAGLMRRAGLRAASPGQPACGLGSSDSRARSPTSRGRRAVGRGSVLTDPVLRAVAQRRRCGESLNDVARDLGVSPFTIYKHAAERGISVSARRRPNRDRYRKLTDHDVRAIARRNQAGESLTALGDAYNVSAAALHHRMRVLGLAVNPSPRRRSPQGQRGRKITDADVRAVVRRNQAGESIASVAPEYGVSPAAICRRMARLGIPVAPRPPRVTVKTLTAAERMREQVTPAELRELADLWTRARRVNGATAPDHPDRAAGAALNSRLQTLTENGISLAALSLAVGASHSTLYKRIRTGRTTS